MWTREDRRCSAGYPANMLLKQYYLDCLSQASYLIGDRRSGVAVVVDPRRDVDVYVEDARAHDLEIRHVFLTHFHADFASGHLELVERCGAELHIGAPGAADFPFTPASEGDSWTFGDTRISVLETPGHTPESISILVHDLAENPQDPHAVLTGDCLFIGDVGRPDLMASVGLSREELAGQLFDSTRDKLLALPDSTLVYPGHGAGSMCGKSLSSETVSTIGKQREFNPALRPMSRDTFVATVCEGQPIPPAYFAYDAGFNKKPHALLDDVLAGIPQLTLDEARERGNADATILDTRTQEAFAAGHLAGSIFVGLDGRFASWVGTVISPETDLVVIAGTGRGSEAATRLGRIGFDRIIGLVEAPETLAEDLPGSTIRTRVTTATLAKATPEMRPLVIDVRQPGEWAAGCIEGSRNIPLPKLTEAIHEIPRDRSVVLHCQTGYRSTIAASLLAATDGLEVSDLEGGIEAWTSAGNPIVVSESAESGPTCGSKP